ncbi:uncharacterized protein LOC129602869 [Paramacrobiotus metropolitanus]|uniref:uncharacterized protein LOC129602869 n=1 Tax=Paramacrobiotus metropolitanus TaxID=2943436 RepID=UPI0024461786|nr:uncharacterized protein LOC129602869 [Paramacrobiotus metropolitanus]
MQRSGQQRLPHGAVLLRSDPTSMATRGTYRSEGLNAWQHEGPLLPLKPYCMTSLMRIEYGGGAVGTLFVRDVGYPGERPGTCVTVNDVTDNFPVMTKVLGHFRYGPNLFPTGYSGSSWQPFEQTKSGNATTSTAAAQNRHSGLRAIATVALLLILTTGPDHILRSVTRMRSVALLGGGFAVLGIFAVPTSALRCYSCKDEPNAPASVAQNCYTMPAMLGAGAIVDCNERKPPPMAIGITMRQTGFCAMWLEQFTNPFGGGMRLSYLARGCVYPGGEEPDAGCLTVNGANPIMPDRALTVTYCRDGDLCNGAIYPDFISECFGGGGTTVTTRDFNVTNMSTMPTTTTTPFIPTLNPQIAEEIKVRACGGNGTTTPDAPGQSSGGISSKYHDCVMPSLLVAVAASLMCCHEARRLNLL